MQIRSLLAAICGLSILTHATAARVTVVTHGLYSDAESWVSNMAVSIGQRTDAEVWFVRLSENLASPQPVETRRLEKSSHPGNGDLVIAFDWSEYAGAFLGVPYYSNTEQAGPWLAAILRAGGRLLGRPDDLLSGNQLHLIGHSRGGSLVCGVAGLLGKFEILVNQVTTLDPHPFGPLFTPDYPALFHLNVLFHDNYYQTSDLVTTGEFVEGAANRRVVPYDIAAMPPSSSWLVSDGHRLIHDFYQRTVDPDPKWAPPTRNDPASLAAWNSWFLPVEENGAKAGYFWAVSVNGQRLAVLRNDLRLGVPQLDVSLSDDGVNLFIHPGSTGLYSFVAWDPDSGESDAAQLILDGNKWIIPVSAAVLGKYTQNLFILEPR